MAFPHNNDVIEIENRNALRANAGLPLLSVAAELRRLQAAREQAEFEVEWKKRKPEFAQWIGDGDGWLTKMGRWSLARRRVKEGMRVRND
jgi:hypothetical protein